jgi:hypothetical protein
MTLSRLLTFGGAAGLVIALLMPWYGLRSRFSELGDIKALTAFQAFSAVDIALLALVLVAALVMGAEAAAARRSTHPLGAASDAALFAGLTVLTLSIVALVLVLIKVAQPLPELTVLRYGARFAVFCAAVMLAGGLAAVYASLRSLLVELRA